MFSILCQAATAATDAAAAAAEAPVEPGFMEKYGSLLMIVGIFVVFYFFMIRPQQKRQKEMQKMRDALTKGDRVVTAGGIHGIIRDVKDKSFVVEIADGVRIRVDKGSVYSSPEDAATDAGNELKK